MTAQKLATRYACRNAGKEWAGLTHTSGNGKPSRKRCANCRGEFYVQTGLWGVFTWTGDGRYPEAAALRTFTREPLAQAYVDAENTRTDYAASLVLRWIYRDDA